MTRPNDSAQIEPTAVVEDSVSIGSGTKIWHHAHLRKGCTLGAGCTIGKNVFIDQGVTIGDGVKIQNNVSVYRGVELQNEVFVGPSVVFTNDRVPRASGEWTLAKTMVREGASIGANATLVGGIELGEWCLVAAGAVVIADVGPHEIVAGNPAVPIGLICRCGTERARRIRKIDCDKCDTHIDLENS